MFYVNILNFYEGNINAYINFDTIYLATYFFHVCLNVQLLNDFLVLKELLPTLV